MLDIDVWEGASGASRDAPRFGLKSNSVSNARKKIRKSTQKIERFYKNLTIFYPLFVTKANFRRGKTKKKQF